MRKRFFGMSFLLFIISSTAAAMPACHGIFSDTRAGIISWQEFRTTKLAVHNDANFAYYVHGINISDEIDFSRLRNIQRNLNSRDLVSLSLITSENRGTYGNFGFIVEVTPKDFVQVYLDDASTRGKTLAQILELKRRPIQYSPEQLIHAVKGSRYNEILIHPTTPNSVKIVGLFVKTFGPGHWFKENLRGEIEGLAQELNLPLIPIDTYGAAR